MRYIQEAAKEEPKKEDKAEKKEERVLPKAGKYDSESLMGGKKLPKTGGNPFA